MLIHQQAVVVRDVKINEWSGSRHYLPTKQLVSTLNNAPGAIENSVPFFSTFFSPFFSFASPSTAVCLCARDIK